MADRSLSSARGALDTFLTDWLTAEQVPGAALAVVEDGETVYTEGYGARDLQSNSPATDETLYGVASVTKSFTALAVLQQVEETDLSLSDPITDYLSVYETPEATAEPPTIHELLSHGSGMPSDGASVVLLSRLTGQDPVEVPLSSEADLDRHVAGALSDRATDEDRFFYYNTGYTILGRLVAELDGRAFPDYVADEILSPLEMTRSRVAPDGLDGIENTMTPYVTEDGERRATTFPVKGVGAAGGLVASVADLGNYLQFQMDGDSAVVGPDRLATAQETHTTRQTYLDGTEQGYGYGWMRRPLLGDTVVEHGGSLGVSTAYVGFLEDAEIGVALACNDSPEAHPQFVGPALLALLAGEDPTEATRFYGLRGAGERVAGQYESHRGIAEATVEPTGPRLSVTFETALSEQSFEAFPDFDGSADPTDADSLCYYTVESSGARVPLEFVETEAGLDVFYKRWRLHRTEATSGDRSR